MEEGLIRFNHRLTFWDLWTWWWVWLGRPVSRLRPLVRAMGILGSHKRNSRADKRAAVRTGRCHRFLTPRLVGCQWPQNRCLVICSVVLKEGQRDLIRESFSVGSVERCLVSHKTRRLIRHLYFLIFSLLYDFASSFSGNLNFLDTKPHTYLFL